MTIIILYVGKGSETNFSQAEGLYWRECHIQKTEATLQGAETSITEKDSGKNAENRKEFLCFGKRP